MTNAEKYKDEILAQLCKSGDWAVSLKTTREIIACTASECLRCLFANGCKNCIDTKKDWLNAEYKERKVFTDDEKALIRLLPKLKWVAKDKCGSVFGYDTKPEKESDAWYSNQNCCNLSSLSNFKFLAVKWEDIEPTSRDDILKSH